MSAILGRKRSEMRKELTGPNDLYEKHESRFPHFFKWDLLCEEKTKAWSLSLYFDKLIPFSKVERRHKKDPEGLKI